MDIGYWMIYDLNYQFHFLLFVSNKNIFYQTLLFISREKYIYTYHVKRAHIDMREYYSRMCK